MTVDLRSRLPRWIALWAVLGSLPLASAAIADPTPNPPAGGSLRDRRSPSHPHTLAAPHLKNQHGGLDVRVRPGRAVLRSYALRKEGWAIDRKVVRVPGLVEDAAAAAARDTFHQVRRLMISRGHWKLGNEKILDVGLDAAAQKAASGATLLSELYTAATDAVVKELKTIDRWAAIIPEQRYIELTTPAVNNVTAHRLPGDVLAVKIRRFRGPVAQQLHDELGAAQAKGPVRGLVLDLRGNGGGSVAEAHALLSQFLPDKQPLLTTEVGRLGRPVKTEVMTAKAPPGGPDVQLPIAVLVDGKSASASELTVGVLKDLGRARLFGDKTYGKGVGQSPRKMADGRMFKQTEWRRVLKGLGPYHGIGISPDVDSQQAASQVADAATQGLLRSRGDLVMRAALLSLWNKVAPASPGPN